ncbi:sulfatase-like hydrolase/transferase [Sphingosinicella microcystinivorans]|uniref:Sulfatase n=1 Tax=Sphingosinicella microcystinivorans TaxID=335406 RepID=A0AAD1G091_SPHMI|nr:sulfatase-like hydrolase/transferase [Sphingosinicella microcystinivorans]RKS85444.1 putative sulfatase [Sphingosinicella microcystinivorans]BBE33266.1 arylsulfatase [Sphingosinicella microcystinivorans]
MAVAGGDDRTVTLTLGPNRHLEAAAARYRDPPPERLPQKRVYLDSVGRANDGAPNIVVILFDDMGYGDIGAYGNPLARTPAIDRLAAGGVKLTQFYATSPRCSPSRVGLMTGRYPVRALSHHCVFAPKGSLEEMALHANCLITHILADEIRLPEILSAAGYRTGIIGKWHLGKEPGFFPNELGFQSAFGPMHSNNKKPFNIYRNGTVEIATKDVDQSRLTALYKSEAVKFIEKTGDGPFFLYMSHTFPHEPHHADPDHRGHTPGGESGDMIADLDRNVAAIMAALERRDVAKNTLVIVTSDNGSGFVSSVGNLRGRKGDTFGGGMRVPGIFHWPGRLPKGKVRAGMAMQIDLLPALLLVAGIVPPAYRVIDSRNLMPLLTGKTASIHDYLYNFTPYVGGAEAVRDEHFKWRAPALMEQGDFYYPAPMPIHSTFSRPILTDIHRDNESYDLSNRYPADQARLDAALKAFRAGLDENVTGRKRD